MNISNILIVSPMVAELQVLLKKEKIEKNFRYLTEEEMMEEDLNWADGLVCFNVKTNVDYSKVNWVHSLGAGVDRFLYKKNWNEDVLLTRTICSFGQRISEFCLSYILRDTQLHNQFEEQKRQKKWRPTTPKLLSEQKVMIFGTGEIGQTAARIFSALGIEVYGVSLSGKEKEFYKEVLTIGSHIDRLSEIDYIINTLPLTEQTAGFFDESFFSHLTRAGFFNVGRGATLVDEALLNALNQNKVRFAVLDVFQQEPLLETHPFWEHPNIFITPHISAVTTPAEGLACFIETLNKIEKNMPLPNRVDVKAGY